MRIQTFVDRTSRVKLSWAVAALALFVGVVNPAPSTGQSSTQTLFEHARAARARGDLSVAEADYVELIRREPSFANAYQNLGILYLTQRRYKDAADVLRHAVALLPDSPSAHTVLGLAYYQLAQPDRAATEFRSALHSAPRDTNALLFLGKSQLQLHDFHTAALTFEKLAAITPQDPDALYGLSMAHMKLMLESIGRLGEVAPWSYQFWLLLAQDAYARGQEESAIKDYREALRIKPDLIGAHYGLGRGYARLGKSDDAEREFKEELKLNGDDPLALWQLGELALHSDPVAARQYLERAVQLNPALPQAALAYARSLARCGELPMAMVQFKRAMTLAPEEPAVHYHLARAYQRLGKNDDAAAEMAKFQQLSQSESATRQRLAERVLELERSSPRESESEPHFSPDRDPMHP